MRRFLATTSVMAAFLLLLSQEMACGQETNAQDYVSLPLRDMSAVTAAKKLRFILGTETHIVADDESNTVFIKGTADQIQSARKILQRLDVPSYLHVIPLQNADAAETAKVLRIVLYLLALLGDDRPVRVSPFDKGILVSASEEKAKEIRTMIRWLDEKAK